LNCFGEPLQVEGGLNFTIEIQGDPTGEGRREIKLSEGDFKRVIQGRT